MNNHIVFTCRNIMARLFAISTLILVPTALSFASDRDVNLTLNVSIQPDKHVRLRGTTNLPPGTKLMLSIEERMENGFFGQSSCFVSSNGTFESEAFGPKGGLHDGQYVADVTMPVARVQSAEVQHIIGKDGQNLSGPLVEKGSFGVSVSRHADFSLGENPAAVQAERKKDTDVATAALKKNVCVLLEQLLGFKDEPKFKKYGFAIGGPYSKWLESVEALRDATPTGQHPIPLLVRAAPGDLLMLGMNSLRGESDYTRQILPELMSTIDYEEYLEAKKNPKGETPTTFRIWRDSTGKFSIEAELVVKGETHLTLRKRNGKNVRVPISKLSAEDVEYVSGPTQK